MRIIHAGLLAGLGMAVVMGVGEQLRLVRVNLPYIDGAFFFKDRFGKPTTYALGLFIHLATSVCFSVGYALFRQYIALSWPWSIAGLTWAAILWLAFGLTVSPVIGYGWFGSKAGKLTWFELLLTHTVFGLTVSAVIR